jgi:hypothetical protein
MSTGQHTVLGGEGMNRNPKIAVMVITAIMITCSILFGILQSYKRKTLLQSFHVRAEIVGFQRDDEDVAKEIHILESLIHQGIRHGTWNLLANGSVQILWKHKGQIIEITGKVVNKIFQVGSAWVR